MSMGWKYTALTVSGPTSWSECFSSTWISSKPLESDAAESSLVSVVLEDESALLVLDAELLELPHADMETAMEPASRMPSSATIFLFFIVSLSCWGAFRWEISENLVVCGQSAAAVFWRMLCLRTKPTANRTMTAMAAIAWAARHSTYGYRPIQSLVGTLLR